ncbi:hypothetical protein FA95DRAFT_369823 [Auriscalpium vulgare]|uniref:Uncharacterized protein n=1 Tax=Auriscalpium vulgare TaxID=40419 RepID=A0ACB8RI41_9AGAM|nr:hypothetical protein FA95DRAFT_369823 [Auriscalpium vulgare]
MWIGDVVADLLVAVTMVWLLTTSQQRYSSRMISKLIRLCVETNVATTTLAILFLTLYFAFPTKPYLLTPGACIGKVYSNTLMVSLNNRTALRRAASSHSFVESGSITFRSRMNMESHASNHAVVRLPSDAARSDSNTPYKTRALGSVEHGEEIELGTMDSGRDISQAASDRVIVLQHQGVELGSF